MQSSPAVGPKRLAEGAGVLVTALQSDHVSFVYSTVLQMGSAHRQQIQGACHCGLPAGPVLLWRDRNSAYALKQADITQSCPKHKSFTSSLYCKELCITLKSQWLA